jgi:hypothetical protein
VSSNGSSALEKELLDIGDSGSNLSGLGVKPNSRSFSFDQSSKL